jgi:exoribonuclease R
LCVGDIVAVELLPKEKWTSPSHLFVDADEPDVEQLNDIVDIISNESNRQEQHQECSSEFAVRPCGRVVGIIKRNWKMYFSSSFVGSTVLPDSNDFSSFAEYLDTVELLSLKNQRMQIIIFL